MSGGIAYVHDPDKTFAQRVNHDMVALEPLDVEDRRWLAGIVARHRAETGSRLAERLMESWGSTEEEFVKVMPRDYRRVLEATELAIAEGRSVDEAVMAAAHG